MFEALKTHRDLLVFLAGAALISGGFALWFVYRPDDIRPTDPGATTTPEVREDLELEMTGGEAKVQEVTTNIPPPPDFERPLVFPADTPESVRVAYIRKFQEAQEVLRRDPTDYYGWVAIGVYRKYVSDYRGAEEAWTYAATLYPQSTVPFDNLGSLYMDFVKDYPRAEANYKRAIVNDPHDIHAYQQLFSLYTLYGYKGTDAARTLIERGLIANPDHQTLLQLRKELDQ